MSTPTFPASARVQHWRDAQARPRPNPRPLCRGGATEGRWVPFEEKMARLAAQWRGQQADARRLDKEIDDNLKRLGFGVNKEETR